MHRHQLRSLKTLFALSFAVFATMGTSQPLEEWGVDIRLPELGQPAELAPAERVVWDVQVGLSQEDLDLGFTLDRASLIWRGEASTRQFEAPLALRIWTNVDPELPADETPETDELLLMSSLDNQSTGDSQRESFGMNCIAVEQGCLASVRVELEGDLESTTYIDSFGLTLMFSGGIPAGQSSGPRLPHEGPAPPNFPAGVDQDMTETRVLPEA